MSFSLQKINKKGEFQVLTKKTWVDTEWQKSLYLVDQVHICVYIYTKQLPQQAAFDQQAHIYLQKPPMAQLDKGMLYQKLQFQA